MNFLFNLNYDCFFNSRYCFSNFLHHSIKIIFCWTNLIAIVYFGTPNAIAKWKFQILSLRQALKNMPYNVIFKTNSKWFHILPILFNFKINRNSQHVSIGVKLTDEFILRMPSRRTYYYNYQLPYYYTLPVCYCLNNVWNV